MSKWDIRIEHTGSVQTSLHADDATHREEILKSLAKSINNNSALLVTPRDGGRQILINPRHIVYAS